MKNHVRLEYITDPSVARENSLRNMMRLICSSSLGLVPGWGPLCQLIERQSKRVTGFRVVKSRAATPGPPVAVPKDWQGEQESRIEMASFA